MAPQPGERFSSLSATVRRNVSCGHAFELYGVFCQHDKAATWLALSQQPSKPVFLWFLALHCLALISFHAPFLNNWRVQCALLPDPICGGLNGSFDFDWMNTLSGGHFAGDGGRSSPTARYQSSPALVERRADI
jgi:hypothetical protein